MQLDQIQFLGYLEKGFFRVSNNFSEELTEEIFLLIEQKCSKLFQAVRESVSKKLWIYVENITKLRIL